MAANRPTSHKASWWLVALIVVLVGVNVLDVWQSLATMGLVSALDMAYPPTLKAGYAAVWALIWLGLAVQLVRQRAGAFRWFAPLVALYGIIGLIGQAIFVRADYARGRLLFQAVTTAVIIALAWAYAIRMSQPLTKADQLPDTTDRSSSGDGA